MSERFARLEQIDGWDQSRLTSATVLVAGIGALGNEVVKNLALLGVGTLILIDYDRIEQSNLCRSILFRPGDIGQPKVTVAADRVREISPETTVISRVADLTRQVGLGLMRRADIFIGALDNRRARVSLNAIAAKLAIPWIDGGIDAHEGIVRVFTPPQGACYACTMSEQDWQQITDRHPCGQDTATEAVPTTPLAASVIGAQVVQETVRLLHGDTTSSGTGHYLNLASRSSHQVTYPHLPSCTCHQPAPAIIKIPCRHDSTFGAILATGSQALGQIDEILLNHEVRLPGYSPPRSTCVLNESYDCWQMTPAQLLLPPHEIIWARQGATLTGLELTPVC